MTPTNPETTLDQALRRYQTWRIDDVHMSPRTWAGEKPGLLAFVDFMASRGRNTPRDVTDEDASAWWQAQDRLADSTKVTRLNQLRSFLGYCRKKGWIERDPTALIGAHRPAAEPRVRLNPDELLALLDAADQHSGRDRVCVALAVNLAVRGGEITRMQIRDADLGRSELRVRVDKTRQVDLMPITSDLARELNRWFELYRSACDDLAPTSPLVPAVYRAQNGTVYIKQTPFTEPHKAVKRALAALGWEDTAQEGVHTVRRSVARVMFDVAEAEEGFDSALMAVMALLHHKRPETTLDYIGRDRIVMARDRMLRDKPFLTRLVAERPLRLAT